MPLKSTYAPSLVRFARVASLLVASVGAVKLLGWIFDAPFLEPAAPGLASMTVNTACGLLAAGVALWFLQTTTPALRSAAGALSAAVTALSGLTLAQDLFAFDLGIDQLILPGASAATPHSGRMAPSTALSFLLIGMALLYLRAGPSRPLRTRANWFAVPPLFLSALALAGHAYGVPSLYRVGPYASMPVGTALCFLVLSMAVLAADPSRGIATVFASDVAGGIMARRLLPTIPPTIFGLGWLCLKGKDAGLYETHFGLALFAVLSITVSVFAVRSTAIALHTIDLKRKHAEAELAALNVDLERRVYDRTQELENTLAHVKQLSGMLPICAWCKKVRDDKDYWQSVEEYVTDRTDARFSHGICPDCHTKMMNELSTSSPRA